MWMAALFADLVKMNLILWKNYFLSFYLFFIYKAYNRSQFEDMNWSLLRWVSCKVLAFKPTCQHPFRFPGLGPNWCTIWSPSCSWLHHFNIPWFSGLTTQLELELWSLGLKHWLNLEVKTQTFFALFFKNPIIYVQYNSPECSETHKIHWLVCAYSMIVSVLVWNTVNKLPLKLLELSFVPICANILEISFNSTLTWNRLFIVDSGLKPLKINNLGILVHRG